MYKHVCFEKDGPVGGVGGKRFDTELLHEHDGHVEYTNHNIHTIQTET